MKRKHLNIDDKSHIIAKLERGISNKYLAKEYGMVCLTHQFPPFGKNGMKSILLKRETYEN